MREAALSRPALTGPLPVGPLLSGLALVQATALVLAFALFGLAGDTLVFMSDAASLAVAVTALSLALFPLVGLGYLGLRWGLRRRAPARRAEAPHLLGQVFITLVAANFVYFVLNLIDVKLLLTVRAKFLLARWVEGLAPEYLWLVAWAALVWWLWRRIDRSAERDELVGRGRVLAAALAPLSLVLLIWLAWVRAPAGSGAAKPRHFVLLVLDGWPAHHMRAYEPAAALDTAPLFDRGRTYTGARSTAVWTNGYFGTLYRGQPSSVFADMDPLRRVWEEAADGRDNLVAALQRGDVRTRGLFYHRNGLPEGSSGRVSNYGGFRSLFSRAEHAPLLHGLGLDYFTVLRTPDTVLNLFNDGRSALLARLISWLAPPATYDNVLSELLLPEMARIRDGSDRTFLLFHVSWYLGDLHLPMAWDGGGGGELVDEIRADDYRYPAAAEAYAAARRAEVTVGMARTQERLTAFLDEAARRALLDDTVILVTADHGHMFRDGRFWYGFHPDEEVVRVPLVAFGPGLEGADDRLVETPDLTQTVLSYFGAGPRLHPRAASLLEPDRKAYAFSATRRSDRHREWFLKVYRPDRAFRLNLHPDGDTPCEELRIDGFAETPTRAGQEVLDDIPEMDGILRELRLHDLPPQTVHPAFARRGAEEGGS